MKKVFAALFFVCALGMGFGAINNACAQPGAPGYPGASQLTPEQQQKATQIFQDNYAAMSSTRQALAAKRAQLDELLASPNPDRSSVETLSREIGELRGKMLSARLALRDELEKNGLSADLYAPNFQQRGGWNNYPPEMWGHGPRHHHRHWDGMMGRGPRGCWNGCMNMN